MLPSSDHTARSTPQPSNPVAHALQSLACSVLFARQPILGLQPRPFDHFQLFTAAIHLRTPTPRQVPSNPNARAVACWFRSGTY
eukprot:scaffold213_cov245-Pinguiococcus_pyrenoidosus.AAC.29